MGLFIIKETYMAGSFSDALEASLLNHVFGKTTYTAPDPVYIALFTTAPNDANTGGVEVSTSGTAYARVSVVNNTTNFTNATGTSPTTKKNGGSDITFAKATANWVTVVAAGIYSASTGGTLLAWSDLTTSKAINTDDTATIAAG